MLFVSHNSNHFHILTQQIVCTVKAQVQHVHTVAAVSCVWLITVHKHTFAGLQCAGVSDFRSSQIWIFGVNMSGTEKCNIRGFFFFFFNSHRVQIKHHRCPGWIALNLLPKSKLLWVWGAGGGQGTVMKLEHMIAPYSNAGVQCVFVGCTANRVTQHLPHTASESIDLI